MPTARRSRVASIPTSSASTFEPETVLNPLGRGSTLNALGSLRWALLAGLLSLAFGSQLRAQSVEPRTGQAPCG